MISPTTVGIGILYLFENQDVNIGIIKAKTETKNNGSNDVWECDSKVKPQQI